MPKLTEKQMRELTDAFRTSDKNGDGKISCDDLASVLRCAGQNPTQADVADMIREMDSNDTGSIEFREFVDCITRRGIKSQEEEASELREAFKVFDRDGNGYITAQELRHTMTNLGECMTEDEVETMIEEADVSGDGKVNYEEFVRIITSVGKNK